MLCFFLLRVSRVSLARLFFMIYPKQRELSPIRKPRLIADSGKLRQFNISVHF